MNPKEARDFLTKLAADEFDGDTAIKVANCADMLVELADERDKLSEQLTECRVWADRMTEAVETAAASLSLYRLAVLLGRRVTDEQTGENDE